MSDFQTRRTTRVANTAEALEKNRLRMANAFWRRVSIEPIEGTQEKVRVRYERVYDRQLLYNEITQEQATKHE